MCVCLCVCVFVCVLAHVQQLTEVVESLNDELKKVETAATDIACVSELWSRYSKKVSAAARCVRACVNDRDDSEYVNCVVLECVCIRAL